MEGIQVLKLYTTSHVFDNPTKLEEVHRLVTINNNLTTSGNDGYAQDYDHSIVSVDSEPKSVLPLLWHSQGTARAGNCQIHGAGYRFCFNENHIVSVGIDGSSHLEQHTPQGLTTYPKAMT